MVIDLLLRIYLGVSCPISGGHHSANLRSPVAWVVTGELFPLKVRAKGLSMTTATNWLLNFAIAYSTPYMVDEEHANLQSKVFFIWGGFCVICITFVWYFIYETKGLTLEQVDELYEIVDQAWKSKQFRPKVNFRESMADGVANNMSLRQLSVAQERKRSDAAVTEQATDKNAPQV